MSDFKLDPFFRGFGKASPGFAGKFGVISVVTEFDASSAVMRDARGWYTREQGKVGEIARGLSVELAKSVAEAAKVSMLRPNVTTGRLQAAILSPKNRASRKEGYGVGVPRFLDRSEAKYWRQIDQGYSGHVGREIRGVFGGTLTGEFGGRSRYGPYPIAGQPYTAIGAGKGGRLLPLGKKSVYEILAKQRRVGKRRPNIAYKSVIENPIHPQQYFLRGWENFNAPSRTTAAVKASLISGLPPGK